MANSGGGGGSGGGGTGIEKGGAGGEEGGGVAGIGGMDDGEICGSSNPVDPNTSLFPAAAVAVANVWKARPMDSHVWTSALGGVELDNNIWDVRFHFDGKDNLERKLGESDITYMNLLAVIETEGYGINDSMYYVKEEGIGRAGMALIDGMAAVEEMLSKYAEKKCVTIFVMYGKKELSAGINRIAVEDQIPIAEIGVPVVYAVDVEGVLSRPNFGMPEKHSC